MVGAFTYRDAIEAGCFLQVPLFGTDELTRAVAARGLADHSISLDWESLDREGLLPPVGYSRVNPLASRLHLQALEEGVLILRDEKGHCPWDENDLTPLYARWQLLSLAELDEMLRGRSPLVMLAGGTKQLSDHLAGRAEALKDPEYPSRLIVHHRQLELLLARTQSLFMPVVRRSYRLEPVIDRHGESTGLDTKQWVLRERRELDYARAAEQCRVSAHDIRGHYEALMHKARRLDPLGEWRDLIDQVERRKIDALKGEALRAQDLYDAAEVMRHWHRHLTGGGNLFDDFNASFRPGQSRRTVNERRYGFEELRGNRAALPGILDHFGIYPWKVMLITEGEGEVAMLEAIVSHHVAGASFEQLGIVPHVMKGSPKKRDQRLLELLGALRRFPNYFLLVFDNEGTAPRWVSRLEQFKPEHAPFAEAALLEPEPERPAADEERPPEGWSDAGYVAKRRPEAEIWAEDIEADNFSESELCDAIGRLARHDGRVEFSLAVEELQRARTQSTKGMASVAQDLASTKGFGFSKVDLDRELGRYAADNPTRDGTTRRVFIVAEHLYHLTVAHRQMRGRLRERERDAAEASDSSATSA